MAKTRERDKKLANRKDEDKKEEGTAAQRQLKRTARDIRRFFEQADASLEQNLIPFLDELAPDVNFAADQAEQMSPYPIEWSGSAKKFAAAEKKFRKSAEKAGYKVPEDSGVRIKFSDQEAKKAPEVKRAQKKKPPTPDSEDDEEEEEPSSAKKQPKATKKPKVVEISDSEDDEEEEPAPTQKKTKGKSKLPTPDSEDDEEEEEPAPAKKQPKATKKPKFAEASDSEDNGGEGPSVPTQKKTKGKSKLPTPYSGDEDEEDEESAPAKKQPKAIRTPKFVEISESADDGEEEEPAPAKKQSKRQKKIATIEEDLEMRDARNEEEGSPEDSSADDSSEEQDNIWPLLFKRVSTQNMNTPAWRALQQDCKLRGCDFVDVKFRLEFLLAHENPDETPNGLLRSARKWIETCPGALELLENGFYGDRKMSRRFLAYRSKFKREASIGSSRSTSADLEELDRVRLISVDPEADRREIGFIDRTKPVDGSEQITLENDPDDPEAGSVTGTIEMSVGYFFDVKLESLNNENPEAERHILVKQSDYTSKRCQQLKIMKASDKDSLKNLKRKDILVVNFASAEDDNDDRWPRTYVVGYIKKKPDEGLKVWSRSVFRTKFGSVVDEEINAARRRCGQKEIRKR
ncbi:hypothetical protein ACKVWE_011482 [Pyricularia oryzae]